MKLPVKTSWELAFPKWGLAAFSGLCCCFSCSCWGASNAFLLEGPPLPLS